MPPPPAPMQQKVTKNTNIVEIKTLIHFLQVIQDNPLVMADFYAVWCGPCKKIEPLFDKLEEKYRGKGK
jgi:thiol-disulfide isomerase/thioredoxin